MNEIFQSIGKLNSEVFYKLGAKHVKDKNYELAKQYYNMAIQCGCTKSFYYLGYIYCNVEKDYESAKKYYLMAIEKGDVKGMGNLAYIYHTIDKDYELAKKYYLMVVEKDNNNMAMNILGDIYYYIDKNY